MSPEQFAAIKNKLLLSSVLRKGEKEEWLALLPRMTEAQTRELDRILSVAPPVPPRHPPRVTGTDALRALTASDMRRAPSVYKFLSDLLAQIKKLPPLEVESAFEQSGLYKAYVEAGIRIMNGSPPIYRPINGQATGSLTKEEVEAITDFRQQLRKSLAAN